MQCYYLKVKRKKWVYLCKLWCVCRDEIQAKVTVKLLWNTNILQPLFYTESWLLHTHVIWPKKMLNLKFCLVPAKTKICSFSQDIYANFVSAWNKMRFMLVWAKWHNHVQDGAFMEHQNTAQIDKSQEYQRIQTKEHQNSAQIDNTEKYKARCLFYWTSKSCLDTKLRKYTLDKWRLANKYNNS